MPLPKIDKEQIEADNKRFWEEAALGQARLQSFLKTELARSRKAKSPNFDTFIEALGPVAYELSGRIRRLVTLSKSPVTESPYHGRLSSDYWPLRGRAMKAAIRLSERVKDMDFLEFDHWIGDLGGFMEEWGALLEEADLKYSLGMQASKKWRELIILFATALEDREIHGDPYSPENFETYAHWIAEVVEPLVNLWRESFDETPACSANSPFYGLVAAIFEDAEKPSPSHNTLKQALSFLN